MKILSVGALSGLSNTCLHRNWALHKIAEQVDEVKTDVHPWSFWCKIRFHLFQLGLPVTIPDNNGENKTICSLVSQNDYDIVWIDKGQTIFPETLQFIKKVSPHSIIVSYSPDNMALRHNQTQQYLKCVPLYDFIVTNKSYIIEDLKKLGAQHVLFVNNSYEDSFHHPRELSEQDIQELGGDVGFIGAWEKERCESICYLADHGIKVRVFGVGKWAEYKNYSPNLTIEERQLLGEDYCKSLQAFKISLCFLRKMNYDQQTTRSVEIPACGGFLMAERTNEHVAMFEEGKEAEFFSSNQELLKKCRFYLVNEEERIQIVEKGILRCLNSGYSNYETLGKVLSIINE
ncbi:MAG: glycosyltransferase [Paludibacteraceae bacterium]|nr:glycosyltransferase [Paludibacteraceae bacterium]